MAFPTTAVIGTNLTDTTATPKFTPTLKVSLSDGGEAMYVKALSEISTYAAVAIYGDGTAQMLTTTIAATAKRIAFAQTSIASGYYGWVQVSGAPLVNLAANCGPNAVLYTTATSGVLDDATVSGGAILGMVAQTSISNATAVTCVAAVGVMVGTGALPSV